jgi:hypothetical protein
MTRRGMEHRKPKAVSSKLDPDKQAAFIKSYENPQNHIGDDEAVLFGDAVHPTHSLASSPPAKRPWPPRWPSWEFRGHEHQRHPGRSAPPCGSRCR